MTAAAETDAARGRRPRAVLARVAGARGTRRVARIAAVALVIVLATQAVAAGYEYGFGEQVLLSIKGISWADPTAYVNDWFNTDAPQPHILFDAITAVAERAGLRAPVYFLYWLASVVVTATGVVLLADAWLPRRARGLELLAGAMLVTGPYFALGTFLVIHREAVPNGLGGALGFLTVVLLVTRRDRAALVLAGLTTVVHVQHGTVVAGALLVAWLVQRDRFRDRVVRWFPVAVVLILGAVYGVGVLRGLVAGSQDVVDICATASPGHCAPDTWPTQVVRDGVLVVLLGVAATLVTRRRSLRAVALLVAPAVVVLVALVTDLADIEPFQTLGEQFFLYRFVMGIAPFAPFACVLLLARATDVRRRWLGLLCAGAGVGVFVLWHALFYANLTRFRVHPENVPRATFLVAAALVAGMAVATLLLGPRRPRLLPLAVRSGAALAVVVLLVFGSKATGFVPLRIDYRPDDGAVALGQRIEDLTPPGSVIAARPDYTWLRLMSRRAVVVDCKSVPYGGEPWAEYNERLQALGAPTPLECGTGGYHRLEPDGLLALRDEYGATHVLLEPGDASLEYAQQHWQPAGDLGGAMQLFELPAD
ncbi:DUF6798 domain-containing protein [Cellulosimicrobium cellulans]|uniref:DUF6798 domain-containing protein n=1 Tax=Cellulosimicrobium cellulans TaxID=1710 RepID=UPI00130EDA89|nr:DUF6798 domain-containing protein [Cellulosimicrobium cellulans]